MNKTNREVKEMYERYPYPSPIVGDTLIPDNLNLITMLFPNDTLANKKILDAGCGTGHRLLATAKRYRKAQILGIDMCNASLEVAGKLAKKHGVTNVQFQVEDILNLQIQEKFDIIYLSGVVHHLENPGMGLKNLCKLLTNRGVIIIWLYHPLGEHERLLDRELLLTLSGKNNPGLSEQFQLMKALGLNLKSQRYGSSGSQSNEEVSQTAIDVDAYMHPIVNAYRFKEGLDLFNDCDVDWAAVSSVNTHSHSKLVDLEEVSDKDLLQLCVKAEDLFKNEILIEKYKSLDKSHKLAVIELMLKPTGFTLIAGRFNSYLQLGKRIQENRFTVGSDDKDKNKAAPIKTKIPLDNYTDFEF